MTAIVPELKNELAGNAMEANFIWRPSQAGREELRKAYEKIR